MPLGTSSVGIANMALALAGVRAKLENFTRDDAETDAANFWYDFSRLTVLEAHNWTFARRRATLATHSEDPPDTWAYRYIFPAGAVAARHIWNSAGAAGDAIPFEIELASATDQKTILTDQEDAVLVYTTDLKSPPLFSAHFVVTLATFLAAWLALALTGKEEKHKELLRAYEGMLIRAGVHDANQEVGRAPRDASWIRDRA